MALKGNMIFKREQLSNVLEELKPLLEAHYLEIAHYRDIPLIPDYEGYLRIESTGALRVFTIREDDKLIGYGLFFVKTNFHYSTSLQAVQDILFLSKERRGHGKKFISWCDEQLRSEGVQVVYHHVKAAHNFGALLVRSGYELVDLIYAKRLD
jgi:hypothetical protein